MAPRTRAHLTPDVLRYSRESAGFDLAEAARRIGISEDRLASAERGDRLITLRQAESAAQLYRRPLAFLFRPTPPDEEPPEAVFRRLPDAPRLPWPSEMRLLARAIAARQEAAEEIYEELEIDPPWLTVGLDPDREAVASVARERLGVSIGEQRSWRDRDGYTGLRRWREAVEDLGVLVMQDGSMEVPTMRGFASAGRVPAIVLNSKDDARARVFTLLHELAHLLWTVGSRRHADRPTEAWCNAFAADVLMPQVDLRRDAETERRARPELLHAVDEVALSYGVTPAAVVQRMRSLGLASDRELAAAEHSISLRSPGSRGGGGDFYRNLVSSVGPTFARLVLDAASAEVISASGAAGLLGARVERLDKVRELVGAPSPAL